jgi:hydroxyacylglutathione hydrolase
MVALEIHQFICGDDNFGLLLHDPALNLTASVDTPDTHTIRETLRAKGWTLTHIFTTHHHSDHTEGHEELKRETNCVVVASTHDRARVPGVTQTVDDSAEFSFGGHVVKVIGTPGHTLGHVAYWIPGADAVFVGDTLFSLGCGRLFEGDAAMMWQSLQKLTALPPETQVYCGHEYTQANARFALMVEPDNAALQKRAAEVSMLRASGRFTLPVTMAEEMATNPFLRPDGTEIQSRLGMVGAPLAAVFGELRARKDKF